MRAARAARSGTVSLRSVLAKMQLTSLFLAFLLGPLEATQQGASWAPDAHHQYRDTQTPGAVGVSRGVLELPMQLQVGASFVQLGMHERSPSMQNSQSTRPVQNEEFFQL